VKIKIFIIILFYFSFINNVYSSSSYIVMDASSNRIIEGSNIHKEKLIASTTKIMTAIIAIENANILEKVEISKDVLKSYGSSIYIEYGEIITLKDLLYGLLLRSGNDAATEIARYVGGSIEEFVNMMNNKAHSLGMNDTNFINPSGLEEQGLGNTSTAYDMAILMSYAIKNSTFLSIIGTKKYTSISSKKTYVWYNKNKLLSSYKYCIGGKTGYTKLAKRTLVTASMRDNKTLIVVTLNNPDDFNTHKSLYEENFNKYNLVTVLKKGNVIIPNNIFYNDLYINNDFDILLTKEEEEKITLEYELTEKENYQDNEVVGKVLVKLDNKILSSKDIYVNKENSIKIEKESFLSKLLNFLIFWK